MEIIPLTKDKYEIWDKFCLESDNAWFWHTTKWLDYCSSYGLEKYSTSNVSFYVIDDFGILAICSLLLEKGQSKDDKTYYEFSTSGSGGFGIFPALRNDLTGDRKDKILKEIFKKVDELARDNQVSQTSFRSNPLALNNAKFNIFMKYGYLDHSLNTQIIDLTLPLEKLWSDLRKGHKHDIHRGEKNFSIHIYDRDHTDKLAFDQYRLLHHKAAGRITRPIETFEMMYEWISLGMGMLGGVSRDGKFAGFSYIILYKDGAYYGSASDDPDFKTDVPISHIAQWEIICWLKEKGYKNYEIGAQQFSSQIFDIPTRKDLSISFFKRGFGGKTVPLYRGVKYYDKEYMRKYLENQLKNLMNTYQVV
jgi:hypothetical protein